jgi:hypothetical protein
MMAVAEEVLTLSQWSRAVKAAGKCARCPRTERLHAHHIDRDRTNNTLGNGECLCVWCHDEEHEKSGRLIAWDEAARRSASTQFTDPEQRQVRVLSTQQQMEDPEQRRLRQESTRRQWKDPEHRSRVSSALKASMKAATTAAWAPGGKRRLAQERRNAVAA